MNNIHSIDDLRLAKKVCSDIPKIQNILENYLKQLYTYKEYRDIQYIIDSTEESLYLLKMHHRNYKDALNKKGKLDG